MVAMLLGILVAAALVLSGCGTSCALKAERDPETGKISVTGSCDFPHHNHKDAPKE